jgi:hypothetical protein
MGGRCRCRDDDDGNTRPRTVREIPSIDLSGLMIRNAADVDDVEIINLFVARMARQLGTDWRQRPLLLKGLWSHQELQEEEQEEEENNHHHPQQRRRLSLAGLLEQEMVVPYFYNATTGAVTPDATGRIRDIVANMTTTTSSTTGGDNKDNGNGSKPHKIATQLLLQKYPTLLNEVIPPKKRALLTVMFQGDYFQPHHLVGSGPFQLLPALTTVPLFVAASDSGSGGSTGSGGHDHDEDKEDGDNDDPNEKSRHSDDTVRSSSASPYTPLHSEPICNLAVQLAGRKHWTLVDARHWRRLRPALAADGRAFVVASQVTDKATTTSRFRGDDPSHPIPRHEDGSDDDDFYYYQGTTDSGDALWLPAWTWHRVDYHHDASFSSSSSSSLTAGTSPATVTTTTTTASSSSSLWLSSTISIGASVFHFRCDFFVRQNPVLALAIIPAMIRELLGRSTQ